MKTIATCLALLLLPLSAAQAEVLKFYHHDALGNLVAMTDAQAQVVWRAEPTAFGAYDSAPSDAPTRFQDEPREPNGLYQLGARFFDPGTGRFISTDPAPISAADLTHPDALNRYTYALNNPYRFHDASGEIPVETILDVLDVGMSAIDLWDDPNWENAGFLAWSIAAAALPYVPGAYIAKAARYGGKAIKAADKAEDAVQIAKKVEKAADALPSFPSCPCFAAGTPVQTKEGLRPIESIKPGELVLARDEETGAQSYQRVARTFLTPEKRTLRLYYNTSAAAASEVTESLVATPDHPFWVRDRGWTRAEELAPGDQLVGINDERLLVVATEPQATPASVYNLEISNLSNYFVGETSAWVHNSCSCAGSAVNAKGRLYHRATGRFVSNATVNTANHVFGAKNLAKHKLGGLLAHFKGDALAATLAIQKQLDQLVLKGTYHAAENVVQIAGHSVTVQGRLIDGAARISTAFVK